MTRKSEKSEEEMVDQFLNYDGEESGATGVESSAANNVDKNTNLATADKADQKVGEEKDQTQKQPEETSEQEPANGILVKEKRGGRSRINIKIEGKEEGRTTIIAYEFDEDWENQVVAVETVTRDDKNGELL
ncbi:11395_t:CDS:2, partial [Racocetra fulgida]